VPSGCGELGLGAKVNGNVSVKSCRAGEDRRYADLPPKSMLQILGKNGWNKDTGLLFAMGYPYAEETWDQVAGFFDKSKGPVDAALQEKLRALVDSKRPMVFCTSLQAPGGGQPDACGPDFSMKVLGAGQVWSVPHFGAAECVWGC